MNSKTIQLATCALLLATTAYADVLVTRYDGALPPKDHGITVDQHIEPIVSITQQTHGQQLKREEATRSYILPFFKIDSTDPGGETTFLSIRNEGEGGGEGEGPRLVTLELFPPNSTLLQDSEVFAKLLKPKETWVLNLRLSTSRPPGPDGFIRGWGRIISSSPMSADFFQFNPSQDFATGGIPLDIPNEYCKTVKVRFLVGGTFDGGTLISFMQNQPLGGAPEDPPSVTGTVYLEDSTMAGTFELRTDDYTFEIDAEDLIAPGVNFGSMDIVFENLVGGGAAFVEYKANNRFSVGTKSVCLD